MKIFYLWPLIITLIFAGIAEYSGGTFSTLRDFLVADLDQETQGDITESEWRMVGRWGSAAYDIQYRYTVNGKDYIGSQVDFSSKTSNAAVKLKAFPIGKTVIVYYDSDKPHYSALVRTSPGFHIYGVMLMLVFCYVFLAWLEHSLSGYKKSKLTR